MVSDAALGANGAVAPVGSADGARLCLFGAAPDTGNLGVAALCTATLSGVARRIPGVRFTVFDYGRGARRGRLTVGDGALEYTRYGSVVSRRYYQPENLWNMRVSGWLGGLKNPGTRAVREADAVLDLTAGDSFTDLYGPQRFKGSILRKQIVLEQGTPLILLPQTYGPFASRRARGIATAVVRGATAAWARDARSFDVLRDLLGSDFDENRHRCGVDVAFLLEPTIPAAGLPERLRAWLADRDRPIVGLNISGLIFNDPDAAVRQYGFVADYRAAVRELVRRFMERTDCGLLLVPHVNEPRGNVESDPWACEEIAGAAEPDWRDRMEVLPCGLDCRETKWVIAQTSWFCGTRMHSTIAALSSGVPTAAVSYSDKTLGVFESCGQGGHVADPRTLGTEELVERLWESWVGRAEAARVLSGALPAVLRQAAGQMDQIVALCTRNAGDVGRRGMRGGRLAAAAV